MGNHHCYISCADFRRDGESNRYQPPVDVSNHFFHQLVFISTHVIKIPGRGWKTCVYSAVGLGSRNFLGTFRRIDFNAVEYLPIGMHKIILSPKCRL